MEGGSKRATSDVDVDVDVVVVGAGPAGAVTAALLAERGRSVVVLERARGSQGPDAPIVKICGEYVAPRAVENLERLGLATEAKRRGPGRIDGMRLVAPDGTQVEARFHDEAGKERAGWSLPRSDLDGALQLEASRRGARFHFDTTVRSVEVEGDRVVVNREFAARLVVGADGRFSCVAHALGLARPAPGIARGVVHAWFRGVDDPESGVSGDPGTSSGHFGEMHFLAGGAYLGLDPLPDGRMNAGLVLDAEPVAAAARARDGEALLRRAIAGSPRLRSRFEKATLDGEVRYLVPVSSAVKSVVAPRALLVGDAAGFLDPLTGEGIHFAIAEAELAAESAERALNAGRFDVAFLRSYARAVARLRRDKTRLHPLLQGLLRRPRLADALGARLSAAPAAAERLLAVIGSLRPARSLLHPRFLAALLVRRAR